MARAKVHYNIQVYFPENKDKLLELRKNMGKVYTDFAKRYIDSLSISDLEKNQIYQEVNKKLIENKNR